jgi:hypothetical protein
LRTALDFHIEYVAALLLLEHSHTPGFGNQPHFEPALIAVYLGDGKAGSVDRNIALGNYLFAKLRRNTYAKQPIIFGGLHRNCRRRKVDMSGGRVAADFRTVLRGALNLHCGTYAVITESSNRQTLKDHVESNNNGRNEFRHSKAYAIDGNTRAYYWIAVNPGENSMVNVCNP